MTALTPNGKASARSGRKTREIERAASQWVARHSLGALSGDFQREFEVWLSANPAHRTTFNRMSGALSALDGAGSIVREADRRARADTISWDARRKGVGLGVMGVALVGFIYIADLPSWFADFRTGRGEQRLVTLADGSRLFLDANAAVNIHYGARERRITLLRGRVHADVKHDDPRPFRAGALGGEVQDVGTAFDLEIEDAHVQLIVTEGAVVARNDGSTMLRTRGQGAIWGQRQAPHELTLAGIDAAGWRYGRLVFDRRPLAEVLRTLDRYSSKPIWLFNDDAAERRVSGVVRSAAIDESLTSLARAQGLKVRNLGIAVVLY